MASRTYDVKCKLKSFSNTNLSNSFFSLANLNPLISKNTAGSLGVITKADQENNYIYIKFSNTFPNILNNDDNVYISNTTLSSSGTIDPHTSYPFAVESIRSQINQQATIHSIEYNRLFKEKNILSRHQ